MRLSIDFLKVISTRSLTRRLTLVEKLVPQLVNHFNSQPHEEADSSAALLFFALIISTRSLTRRLTK